MRIDLTTLGVEPPENGKTGRAAQTAGTGIVTGNAANSTTDLDQDSFSFGRGRVQSLAAQVLAQPEVRGDKVEALQQAIGQGEYSVPPSQIADAMLNDAMANDFANLDGAS